MRPVMLLAVDVGNSHTTVGVFEGETLRCELRLATRRGWTRDELAVGLHQALGLVGIELASIDEAICMRHSDRYCIGGEPSSSTKRSCRADRERPIAPASSSIVQG